MARPTKAPKAKKSPYFEYVPLTSARPLITTWLAALYLAGAGFWLWFFNPATTPLLLGDWAKESAYLDAIRQALTTGTFPLMWNGSYYPATQYFLANFEVTLTPDVLLARWLPNPWVAVIHVIVLYSLGFAAAAYLARLARAGLVPLTWFWLLLNLNGYLTAHFTAGHLQWAGLFLVPAILAIVLLALGRTEDPAWRFDLTLALWLGATLGLLLVNGSIHIAIWCAAFLVLVIAFKPRLWRTIGTALGISVVLGAFRLLPGALYRWPASSFVSGYNDVALFFRALLLTGPTDFDTPPRGVLGFWEYDVFLGFTAFAVVLITVVVCLRHDGLKRMLPVVGPAAVLLVLSMGPLFGYLRPLLPVIGSTQRVSARFIAIPLVVALFLSMRGLAVAYRTWRVPTVVGMCVALPLAMLELGRHASFWRLAHVEQIRPGSMPFGFRLVANTDPAYARVVVATWVVSLAAWVALAAWSGWRAANVRRA